MAVIVLAGSVGMYVGKDKKIQNKGMVLLEDTKTSATHYRFKVDGHEKDILIKFESIEWIKRDTHVDDSPLNFKFLKELSLRR